MGKKSLETIRVKQADRIKKLEEVIKQTADDLEDMGDFDTRVARLRVHLAGTHPPVKTETQYVENGGIRCPYCDSTQLEGESVEIDGPTAYQEIFCSDCDKQWTDYYKLTGFNPTF